MKKVTKITPPQNITCPHEGISILDFYKGHYESVYLILSPFLTLKNPKESPFKKDSNWPSKKIISETCEKVKWSEVLKMSKIESLKKLDIALREYIGGIKVKDSIFLKKLQKATSEFEIIIPPEGYFQELLIDEMMEGIKSLGYEKVSIGDEFGLENREVRVDEILNNKTTLWAGENNIYTLGKEVLFSVHWDSHFTLLCSKKENIEKLLKLYSFEGFFCTSKTSIYWGLDE